MYILIMCFYVLVLPFCLSLCAVEKWIDEMQKCARIKDDGARLLHFTGDFFQGPSFERFKKDALKQIEEASRRFEGIQNMLRDKFSLHKRLFDQVQHMDGISEMRKTQSLNKHLASEVASLQEQYDALKMQMEKVQASLQSKQKELTPVAETWIGYTDVASKNVADSCAFFRTIISLREYDNNFCKRNELFKSSPTGTDVAVVQEKLKVVHPGNFLANLIF